MNRTVRRLLALVLCLLLLPLDGTAARAADTTSEPPRYMRELSRLVAATASEGDFGEIRLTVGKAEMEVDGETQPIADDERVVPYVDENDELQIPVGVIDEADLNGSGFLSAEELETQGYDVRTDAQTGTVIITEPYQQCRLIVKTADGNVKNTHGATHVIRVSNNKTVLQYADKETTARAADAFKNESNVLFCVPDGVCSAFAAEASAAYKSWGTEVAGADQFMASLPDELPQVTVAVLDTGADMDHPFLAGRLADNGWDFANDDNDPDDDESHGTHCAGIIRDATPANVRIMPVKVLDANGSGKTSVIVEGMTYAADNGAAVISMSLGGRTAGSDALYADAVDYARSKGACVFAASGNDGVCLDAFPLYPASCDSVITVAATTPEDKAASYSNYGACVDIAAPGSDVLSAVPGGGFASFSGTSMACQFAAACGALLKCEDPSRTPDDLCAGLCAAARDAHTPGRDDHVGSGIVYLGADRPVENMYCTQSELTLEPLADVGRAIEVVFEPAHPSDCSLVFQSSDPGVAAVSQTGFIHALSAGTAVITASTAQGDHSVQINVTVTGDEKLRFKQVESVDYLAMRFLQSDGTAYAHGYSDSAFGYYTASDASVPFKMFGTAREQITDIAHFLTENFFVKTDGSLWLIGLLPTGDRLYNDPIPLMLDAQTPMTGVSDARYHIVLRADGSLWYLPKNGEPYFVPVCSSDGEPLTGIARLGTALWSYTYGVPAVAADGRAYILKTDSRTYAVTALPVTDASGTPYTDVQDAFVLYTKTGLKDQFVLHEDGTVTDKNGTVQAQDVQSIVCGCESTTKFNYCYALQNDGSVWDVINARAWYTYTATVEPLRDVVLLKCAQPNQYTAQFFAVCADGTVRAWGRNGVRKNYNASGNAEVFGSLGIGWTDGTPASFAAEDGVSYAYLDADEPVTSAPAYNYAVQVMVDEDTALTDVTDVCANGWTNFFIRTDGSVYCSGVRDYSAHEAIVLHTAVYARPFTLLGQQVYLDDTESLSPYTTQRVRTITVSKPDMAATVGETFTLSASVFPQDTYERNIYWKSSDPSVATVDGAGNVTARAAGVSVIRAYSVTNDRVWGTCLLTVEEEAPASVTVRQYPAQQTYTTADTFDPTDGLLTLRYRNGQVRSIRISPDFCSGYDLTQTGGQTVTICFAGNTSTYPITVREAQPQPAQNAAAVTASANGSYVLLWNRMPTKYLYVRGEELDVSGGSFFADSWDAQTPLTADMCTGFDPTQTGAQTVTVRDDAHDAALTFDVFVSELVLENEAPRIEVGKCTRILASFAPTDVDGREIVWTSGDESVATVDKYGRVTGVSSGEVTITAQVRGSETAASCTVTVRTPGDADCDGDVDTADIVLISRYLAGGWNAAIFPANADVNADSVVSLKDVVLIRRYLAGGWGVELI